MVQAEEAMLVYVVGIDDGLQRGRRWRLRVKARRFAMERSGE